MLVEAAHLTHPKMALVDLLVDQPDLHQARPKLHKRREHFDQHIPPKSSTSSGICVLTVDTSGLIF